MMVYLPVLVQDWRKESSGSGTGKQKKSQTIFQGEKKKVEILEQPAQIHTASEGQSGVECRQCESSWIAEAKLVTIVAGGTWHAENIYLEED